MSNTDVIALIWALVGAIAALASMRVGWPVSLMFCALGVGAAIMAIRTERS